MVKRVIIIHGWEGNSDEVMLQYIKNELENNNFVVSLPDMPDTEEPEIGAWVNKISSVVGKVDNETFFVGHSIGCQAILRYLQTLDDGSKIGGCVFIAPWFSLDEEVIREEGEEVLEVARPWLDTSIDFNKVRSVSNNFVCLFSDDDPFVPLGSNKSLFKKILNAKIIIEHNKGHFTPDSGVVDNPVVVKEILRISS